MTSHLPVRLRHGSRLLSLGPQQAHENKQRLRIF
jgi:hypothetical protein